MNVKINFYKNHTNYGRVEIGWVNFHIHQQLYKSYYLYVNIIFFLGAVVTMGFLSVGLKNMYEGDKMKSQMMMRGRIAAQGFTVVAILGGLFYQGMKTMKEIENDDKEFAALPK